MRILFFLATAFLLIASCHVDEEMVVTVRGCIPASRMGMTLAHEHILVDFIGADSTGYQRWKKQEVIRKAMPFLEEIQQLGCKTFIECTPAFVGRDPELLRMLSVETGLNILTNTGLYGARNNKFIPEDAFEKTAEKLAAEWTDEFNNGIEGTGIRPGFIKIAVDREDSLSEMHEKLIRAAAMTHLKTGLVIKSHTGREGPAFAQLEVLIEMGVPPEEFIWTHAQRGTLEGWSKAAEMGAWISIDNIKSDNIEAHARNLRDLKDSGLLDHILISHDSGWYRVGEENGGNYNGYTTIFREFIPELKNNGFTDADIEKLLVINPARAFSIKRI